MVTCAPVLPVYRVVVGVDGGSSGWRALDRAADEAAALAVPLRVLHAPEFAVRHGREVLAEAAERARARQPTVEVRTDLVAGSPGPSIAAQIHPADILVLTYGRTGEYLLRNTQASVLAIPGADQPAGTPGPFDGHVIAAVDNADTAGQVIGTAFTEAASHGWPVAIVYMGPSVPEIVGRWRRRYPELVVRLASSIPNGARLLVIGHERIELLLARSRCPVLMCARTRGS